MVAHFDRSDIDRRMQLAFPIFDVRVCTYDAGLLVIAWYCVPQRPPPKVTAPE